MGKINFALLNCSAANYSPVNVSGAGFAAGGGKKSYTVAELCAMGYGVATDYGYNMKGDFASAGVPIPTDLAARLSGEDGVLLKVTGLRADEAFWEAVRKALAAVTVNWSDPLRSYFNGTNIGGDVEMTVTGGEYQTATNLGGQGLRKLTLNLPSGFVSVMSNAFVWAVSLEEFVVNGTVKANDWTGAFDHCTALTSFTAPQWDDNASLPAYSYGVSYMTSAFQNCTALTAVPQYGADREAEANTLRPVAMQNMLNASGVTVLGPVVDMRYIDPAGTQAAGAFGTQLQDARLMNLNHGDWWLDGTAPEDGVSHGNLSNLDAESVEYLMAHLWDLSTDKTGKNWRTVENSWKMWTVDSPAVLDGDAAVSIPARSRSGAQASYVWTSQGLTGWTVRVSGLQTGDKLCIGNVVNTPGDDAITTDGDYTLTWEGAGYVVVFNDEEVQPTGAVRLEIVNEPYDEGNHLVDAAALHVPESWREKLKTDMLASAAAMGWSVWIGEENLTAGLPSIFDSLVLWYDLAKQGATNETMAENPVLKDLSGHGHDATCYNFGWAGMSGIGGYAVDFTDEYPIYVTVIEHTYKIIHCTTTGTNCWPLNYNADKLSVKPFSAKVSGLNGQLLNYFYYDGTIRKSINITSDGVYDFPQSILADSEEFYCGFYIPANGQSLNVLIEQLPQYPGALVSDGVDDYCVAEGIPILDDFTIYTSREYINGGPTSLATKYLNTSTEGAFQLERAQIAFYSFGNYNAIKVPLGNTVYATPTSYNGVAVERGNGVDSNRFSLFSLNGTSGSVSAALYRLILFNRTLTDEEIEWVKANLMDEAEPEPTPELDASLVDAWVFSGYRNEDAPESVTGEKGHALALGNFAYAEGSGFSDGRLVTDGVDDYAENLEMPVLTDYTLITRRTLMNFEAYASVASKAYGARTNGAFLFECRDLSTSGPVPNITASFKATKEGTIINNAIPEEVSWQTKTSYNGKSLSPGNLADGKLFYLASTRTTGNCVAAKFAWCALYDRSLTQEEINAEVAKLDALWEARKV